MRFKKIISLSILATVFFTMSCVLSPQTENIDGDTSSDGTNFTFGGVTVTGYQGPLTDEPFYIYSDYTGNFIIEQPIYSNNMADSFFICEGNFTADLNIYEKAYIRVEKVGTDDPVIDYYITENGPFEQVAFLRFGGGDYLIKILIKEISTGTIWVAAKFGMSNSSPHDFRYLMPTSSVQSLKPEIRSQAEAIVSGISDESAKARAIHDWVVLNLVYDGSSSQDAFSVLQNRAGVCQGYSCLTAALFRSIDIPAKYVRGYVRDDTNAAWPDEITHAWNEVYYNGKWNIMDVTWDDPLINDHNDYPEGYNLRYTYFEPELNEFYERHTNWVAADYRQIENYPVKHR